MKALIALIAGAVYPLGFAPFGWWPLTVLSVALIFNLWTRANLKQALWLAIAYGCGVYGVGVSWVYVSMVNFGNMLPLMAAIAVVLFVLLLTSFFVLLVAVYKLLSPYFSARNRLTVLLPVLWVISEYLRGTLFTGFSWLYLGYVSLDTWLSSWATISGVLLASFILAVLAGLIAYAHEVIQYTRRVTDASPAKSLFRIAALSLAIIASAWGVQGVQWSQAVGAQKNVTLVQANIALSEKWRPENREKLMQTYLQASRAVSDTDLFVWPEGAMPMLLDDIPEAYIQAVRELEQDVIFGAVKRNEGADGGIFNSMVLVQEQQQGWPQLYRKRHLVPFGEFFPLQSILGWIFETMQVPISNFRSGPVVQPYLKTGDIVLLPTICYEDAYPEDWRHQVSGAHAIVNISEDAWFGNSLAPHQRLQMARMRAIEMARPFIRVSNSGLSTVIDSKGHYDAITPQFTPALLTAPFTPMQGDTPYVRFGYWPLWAWMVLCLAYGLYSNKSKGSKTP